MSEVGPDASGSNPGFACSHIPDRSGMDCARSLCPMAGVTKAAATVSTRGKSLHRKSTDLLLCAGTHWRDYRSKSAVVLTSCDCLHSALIGNCIDQTKPVSTGG